LILLKCAASNNLDRSKLQGGKILTLADAHGAPPEGLWMRKSPNMLEKCIFIQETV
jgi:hypothetical protein